ISVRENSQRTKNDRVDYELDAKQGLVGNLKSSCLFEAIDSLIPLDEHLATFRGTGYSLKDEKQSQTGQNRERNWKEREKPKPKFPKYVLESVLEECKFNVDERFHDELGLEREQVGYVTESQDKCCAETVLKYMTDFALRALETRIDLQVVIIASIGESKKFGSYFNALTIGYNRMCESEDIFEENHVTYYYAFISAISVAKRTFLPARPSEHGLAGRKVLFATETSFSMEDVKYVVDSGYTEFQTYDRMLGVEYVKKTRISKAIGQYKCFPGRNASVTLKEASDVHKMYTHDVLE
ncbi:hypothetical protein Tco_0356480, partial [Tanacetum coccineum]